LIDVLLVSIAEIIHLNAKTPTVIRWALQPHALLLASNAFRIVDVIILQNIVSSVATHLTVKMVNVVLVINYMISKMVSNKSYVIVIPSVHFFIQLKTYQEKITYQGPHVFVGRHAPIMETAYLELRSVDLLILPTGCSIVNTTLLYVKKMSLLWRSSF